MSDTPRTDAVSIGRDETGSLRHEIPGELVHADFARELERELSRRGWQPIESAPKDGTEILGYREDCGAVLIRWISPAEFMTDAELADNENPDVINSDEPDWFYADFVHGGRMSNDGNPTHWMPLPEGPK